MHKFSLFLLNFDHFHNFFHIFTKNSTISKNTLVILFPGGARLGAHPLTSRGFVEEDFKKVVELVDKAVEIAKIAGSKTKNIKEFKAFIDSDAEINAKCDALRAEVQEFAVKFPMPGFDNH